MNKQHCKKLTLPRTLLAATLTITAMTLAFYGLVQIALASELGQAQTVATSYPKVSSVALEGKTVPAGYVKQQYTLTDSKLEYYKDKKPTSLDITREEAAEYGVQALYRVYGLSMDGKEIEMAYNPAQNGARAYWEGIWWMDGKKASEDAYVASYSFRVDAISGEVMNVIHDRVLKQGTNDGFDTSLSQSHEDYASLAQSLAVKLGAVQGAVKTVEYAGQGKANNDPDIFFNVTDENGMRAQLRFSRHDKELLAVTFDLGMKEMDIAIENAQDFEQEAEAFFKTHPDAQTFEQ